MLLEGPFDWMATLVAGIALTEAAVLRGEPEAAVERARATVAALTDEAGHLPSASVRFAALALTAVADAAVELRASRGEWHRWKDTADELVELARQSALHGEDGSPQGPEGMAWLARAEAEWLRAVSGPDAAAWEKAVTAFGFGTCTSGSAARCGSPRPCWRPSGARRRPCRPARRERWPSGSARCPCWSGSTV